MDIIVRQSLISLNISLQYAEKKAILSEKYTLYIQEDKTMAFNVTTNPYNNEAVIDGKKYKIQSDRYGEFVIIDGKRVDLSKALFDNYFDERIEKASDELNEAKEKASMWGKIFDFNLQGVRDTRKERIAFTREYGSDLSSMEEEQREQYKAILAKGSEFSSSKNIALSRQLSYTHQVINLAGNKMDLINQASIFGV